MHYCLPNAEAGASADRTALVPVFAALESARYLRRQVEDAVTAVDEDLTDLWHEAAMLRHWIHVASTESSEYSALIDGLDDYVRRVETVLTNLAPSHEDGPQHDG